jgi:hypothetical protein
MVEVVGPAAALQAQKFPSAVLDHHLLQLVLSPLAPDSLQLTFHKTANSYVTY